MENSKHAKQVNELKLKGNKSYAAGNYLEAIDFYSSAIEFDSENALLYSNRSMANLKLKRSFEAERDADTALRLNATLDKAYYRRAIARKDLNRYTSAIRDLKRTLELCSTNIEAQRELETIEKFVQQNKTVKLVPVDKPESLRSKNALKPLMIHFEVEIHQDVSIINDKLSETIRKLALKRIPTNAVEFERDWREFTSTQDRLLYLEKLDIELLKRLVQYQLEPKMFQELIEVLHESKNDMFVFDVLTTLSKVSWLPLIVMLLDEQYLSLIATILSRFSSSSLTTQKGFCSSNMLHTLHQSFGL